jgi:hypothetical protein
MVTSGRNNKVTTIYTDTELIWLGLKNECLEKMLAHSVEDELQGDW